MDNVRGHTYNRKICHLYSALTPSLLVILIEKEKGKVSLNRTK